MIKNLLKFLPLNDGSVQSRTSGKFFSVLALVVLVQFSASAQRNFVKNITLVQLFTNLEAIYGVTFSYDVNLIKDKKVKYFEYSRKSLEKDLVALLRESDLGFERIDNDIIIKRVEPTFFEQFYTKICGQVFDAEAGLPLGHVSVSVRGTHIGKNADSLGIFSLKGPFVGSDLISVSFIGYEPRLLKMSFFLNKPCKTIFLHQKNMEIAQVIVREDYNQYAGIKISELEPDVTVIRPEKMTGTGGLEPKDVFGSLQQIPGVNSADESATALNVRGGSSGQNLVMFDDIPLYHYGHLFGKISSFNTNLVQDVRFNKGSFSAQNGGRVSSIIDIRGKKEVPKEMNAKAKLGLLSADVSAELPFYNHQAALFVGYRKSIFDRSGLNRTLFDQVFQDTRVEANQQQAQNDTLKSVIVAPQSSFYDFFAKAIWQPNEKDFVEITGLKMGDKLNYSFSACANAQCNSETDSLKVFNVGSNLSWRHHWQPNFYSGFKYSYSGFKKQYDFRHLSVDSIPYFERKLNAIKDYSLQFNNRWIRNDISVNFGYQYRKIHGIIDNQDAQVVADSFYDNSIGVTNSLFVDYRHELGDKFHLFLGVRASDYSLIKHLFFEPRFTVTSNPTPFFKIKMSGGVYFQTMNQLLIPESLFGNSAIWILSKDADGLNQDLYAVQKSSQVSIGATYRRDGWQASLELYDKQVDGMSSKVVDLGMISPHATGILSASGFEVGVQKWGKKAYSILSFSQGQAAYQFPGQPDKIPASYHQRRQLNLLQGYKYKGLTATVNWKIKSGLPYTAISKIEIDTLGAGLFDYSLKLDAPNSAKLPLYSRVDVGLMYEHGFSWGKASINLSVINVLNHSNILHRRYDLFVSKAANHGLEDPQVISKEREGLPITPNISVGAAFRLSDLNRRQSSAPAD